ncbi:uncharacterized protein BDZ99DRAFT_517730 [Mytilinidion resinicola]|uniref:Heterokaryon incompatibility domain-containing protein n=1 Tax=Mytilinidion resinicola TaxID=574789 RepID=A0A6A6YZN3_9PEZI|nr:uncharacterized protein BDZ99DRAFT_517730 [Mytilinidion resinicola]KAF2813474.1 hypothetical protein BDZ99DRAFT_517730 [Mytilinidion resinicola]
MSYVWGSVSPIKVPCQWCGQVLSVPVLNRQRFENLMELGGSGNSIWLDAVSIDRSDHQEIAATVPQMGSVYGNASCVAVLLPESDFPVFDCLQAACQNAIGILSHLRNFFNNEEVEIEDPSSPQPTKFKHLAEWSQLFFENLKQVQDNLQRYTYWRLEGGPAKSCYAVKSLILGAGLLFTRYQMMMYQYAVIRTGLTRGTAPPTWKRIQTLFPDEQFFRYYEEIDPEEQSFQVKFPNFGMNHLLRVRDLPQGSTLEDEFDIALLKAMTAIRKKGLVVQEFLPPTIGGFHRSWDRFRDWFRDYAREHIQSQTGNRAVNAGAPIFTAQADLFIHLGHSILNVNIPTRWSMAAPTLRTLSGAEICEIIHLDDVQLVQRKFASTAHGELFRGHPVMQGVRAAEDIALATLKKCPIERVSISRLCLVQLPFRKQHSKGGSGNSEHLYTWAITPCDIPQNELFVARESLNGTIVLATRREELEYIAAYLTLTDHHAGTLLVKSDGEGRVDIPLKMTERADQGNSRSLRIGDRMIRGQISLGNEDDI